MTIYVPTTWTNEVPASTPIKYSIVDDIQGELGGSAEIEIVTSVTPGTPVNAANMNHIELGIKDAQDTANAALAAVTAVLSSLYPVGCIYITTIATNPNTIFGFGTWVAFGAGRTLVGVGTSDAVYAAAATGGASTHQLTSTEMPTHTHTQNSHTHTQNAHTHIQNAHNHVFGQEGKWWAPWVSGSSDYGIRTNDIHDNSGVAATATNQNATAVNQGAVATNQNAGGNGAHNNMPPYIVVYFWKRTG